MEEKRSPEDMLDIYMLSEITSYYNDFDGTLEESLFDWIITRFRELKSENHMLKRNQKQ